jgi:hypothetical protein
MKRLEVYMRWRMDHTSPKLDYVKEQVETMAEGFWMKVTEYKFGQHPGPEPLDTIAVATFILEDKD